MTRRTVATGVIVVLALALLSAIAIKTRGFRASSTPTAFEGAAARLVRDFAIPRSEQRRTNPLAADAEALAQGRDEFQSRCAICHGSDGSGATPIGAHVYPRVPNLHDSGTQRLPDGALRYIIANGIQLTGMPAMAQITGQEERTSWALVTYLPGCRNTGRAGASVIGCDGRSIRRFTRLRAVSHRDLSALEIDADGQRRARSAGTSGRDHP
jgi:mono/diheme cytochrome c family protein